MVIGALYLRSVNTAEGRKEKVELILAAIKKSKLEFEAIAFRGISGAMIAPVVAHLLDKQLLAVRKGERRHSSADVEGYLTDGARFIIIDDQIETGQTVWDILETIDDAGAQSSQCVGIFLYTNKSTFDSIDHGTNTIPVFIA